MADAAITSGSTTLTSATANFASADVGKYIGVQGAGAVQLATPTVVPTVTASSTAANANMPVGTYTFAYSFTNLTGETQISPASVSITTTVSNPSVVVNFSSYPTYTWDIRIYVVSGPAGTVGFTGVSGRGVTAVTVSQANGYPAAPASNTASLPLVTTISSVTNSTTAVLAAAASTTVGPLAVPVNGSFSTASTGGSLNGGATYYYRVTALTYRGDTLASVSSQGETLASTETSIAVPSGTNTNTVTVTWGTVSGATGYTVYGRSQGGEQKIAFISAPTTSYTDTGTYSPTAALPTANSTGSPTTWGTDDTTAIAQATTAAANGTVYFPPGLYLVGVDGVVSLAPIIFRGAGRDRSIIKFKHGTGGGTMLTARQTDNVEVHDLTLDGNAANCFTSHRLLWSSDFGRTGLYVQNVRFTGMNYVGLECGGRNVIQVERCQFDSVGPSNLGWLGGINTFVNLTTSRSGRISVTNCILDGTGISIGRCDYIRVVSNHLKAYTLQGGWGDPVAIEDCHYVTVTGNVVEGPAANIRVSNSDQFLAGDNPLDQWAAVNSNILTGGGISLRGNRISCVGNTISGSSTGGIEIVSGTPAGYGPAFTAKWIAVVGNMVSDCAQSGISATTYTAGVGGGTISLTDLLIADNIVKGCGTSGLGYGLALSTDTAADLNNSAILNNDFRGNTSGAIGGSGYATLSTRSDMRFRNNLGVAPIGNLSAPVVPSSTSPLTSPFGCDCTVHVSGGIVSVIAVGGAVTGLTSGSFRVPAGQTITLTYSAAPTWTWFAD